MAPGLAAVRFGDRTGRPGFVCRARGVREKCANVSRDGGGIYTYPAATSNVFRIPPVTEPGSAVSKNDYLGCCCGDDGWRPCAAPSAWSRRATWPAAGYWRSPACSCRSVSPPPPACSSRPGSSPDTPWGLASGRTLLSPPPSATDCAGSAISAVATSVRTPQPAVCRVTPLRPGRPPVVAGCPTSWPNVSGPANTAAARAPAAAAPARSAVGPPAAVMVAPRSVWSPVGRSTANGARPERRNRQMSGSRRFRENAKKTTNLKKENRSFRHTPPREIYERYSLFHCYSHSLSLSLVQTTYGHELWGEGARKGRGRAVFLEKSRT